MLCITKRHIWSSGLLLGKSTMHPSPLCQYKSSWGLSLQRIKVWYKFYSGPILCRGKEVHRGFVVWINLLEIKYMLQSGSDYTDASCMTEERIIHIDLLPYKRRLLLVPGRGSSYQHIELSREMKPQEPWKLHQQVAGAGECFLWADSLFRL